MTAPLPLPAALTPAPLDDEVLAAEIENHDTERIAAALVADRKPWRIEDDRAAEWAGRKLAAAAVDLERIGDQATEWRAEIDRWFSDASRKPQREADYFTNLLVDFARRRREADPTAKTLRLPSVTVSSRGSDTPRPVVTDDETVCNWLRGRALDAYFTVKYSPKRRELTDSIEVKVVTGATGPCPACDGSGAMGQGIGAESCLSCAGLGLLSDPDYLVPLLDGEEVPGVEIQEPTVSFTVKPTGGA